MNDTKEKPTILELNSRYPLIMRYCHFMRSNSSWLHDQLYLAHKLNSRKDVCHIDPATQKETSLNDIDNDLLLDILIK